ncbi:RNA deprotection pyrophosphohydrolase [Halalkalibacter sp. APA_J-10(15)]|uniref:RNA deprotection pyrophosphohydrolase n=1 Tax=unclassified Halalkalibacter TaxID=2893063 RepID=UPI001FF385EE|nr:nucleoside triphosphatase YtkD [Halalkalibacter sp. APA_J-10(15)]MCK0471246.1 nucleoside triphosphatase YtkD [Halalkalibacter sp. APA_J-10(15)]
MIQCMDQNGCLVHLRLGEDFTIEPEHVLVFCRFKQKWLVTNHCSRGLEFPGGKKEKGESLEEAAFREVWEETGAILSQLKYCGFYVVNEIDHEFHKAIFFAEVIDVESKEDYGETGGPVLVKQFPENIKHDNRYSFIMKDDVLPATLSWLKREGLTT